MDAVSAGLVGTLIGAVAGVGGSLVSIAVQAKLDREKWLRDKRVEAYLGSIRYLIRVSNKRSFITADGKTVLGKDAMKEWFDEISEARSSITSLVIYCSAGERPKIVEASQRFEKAAGDFITSGPSAGDLDAAAHNACIQIADSARKDVGAEALSPFDDLPI